MTEKKNLSNLVSVYGPGIKGPLLQSNDVRLIQIHDETGKLVAMVTRLTEAIWGITTQGDPDWEDHKKHLFIDDSQ